MPVYWGDMHGHSNLSDGRSSPDDYYAFGREEAALDFCALADYLEVATLPRQEAWDLAKAAAAAAHEPGRFVTLVGYERSIPSWDARQPAYMGIYFKGADGPFCPSRHLLRDWLRPGAIHAGAEFEGLWAALKEAECFNVVHHSNSLMHGFTWTRAAMSEQIHAVEIYSKWGASEALAAPFPVLDGNELFPRDGGSARDALNAGFRVAFVGGSDTRQGIPGGSGWEGDWGNALRYEKAGLTAVLADELSREAVFDALKARRCYATTGERIGLEFTINQQPMGSVLTAPDRLRLHVQAEGTRPIKRIEIFRNGALSHHKTGGREDLSLYIDEPPPTEPTWYYVRITQVGEDYAWSSPIWIVPQGA
jgi:hypothetical protein